MTIIAAYKKDNNVWLVSDRQTNWGHFARRDQVNGAKFVKFKYAMVATTGSAAFKNGLRAFMESDWEINETRFNRESDVAAFFFKFHNFMNEHYGVDKAQAGDAENQFLVVTADAIYNISAYPDVIEFDNFTAIGSGAEVFQGALLGAEPYVSDAGALLARAYDICCQFLEGCGGEADILNVTKTLKPGVQPISSSVSSPVVMAARHPSLLTSVH